MLKPKTSKPQQHKPKSSSFGTPTITKQVDEAAVIVQKSKALDDIVVASETLDVESREVHRVNIILNVIHSQMPRTAEELYKAWYVLFGKYPPTIATADYVRAPFEALADMFFENVTDVIMVAPRGGGKTQGLAELNYMNMLWKPGIKIIHAAADRAQAEVSIGYMKEFAETAGLRTVFKQEPTNTKVRFLNRSSYTMKTGSVGGVSGNHPNITTLDEVELMSMLAVEQATGTAVANDVSDKLMCLTSTRQFPSSTMDILVSGAEDGENGYELYLWSCFECMRRCKTCIAIDQAPHGTDKARDKICPLWSDCHGIRGRLSNGWISREQLISQKKKSKRVWETQYLCNKPVSTGLVLEEFEHAYAPEGNYTDWTYDPASPYYVFHDPAEGKKATAFLVQTDDNMVDHVFDEFIIEQCSSTLVFKAAFYPWLLKRGYGMPEALVVDFHRTDAVADWRSETLGKDNRIIPRFNAVVPKVSKAKSGTGSNLERLFSSLNILRVMIVNGQEKRNFLVNPARCKALVHAFKHYSYATSTGGERKSAKPREICEDEIDACRYWAVFRNQLYRQNTRNNSGIVVV